MADATFLRRPPMSQAPSDTLHQVFYVSRSMATPDDIQALLRTSVRRNAEHGLTGALLFTGGCFAQVLEGAPQALHDTMKRIAADSRHRGLRVLLQEPLAQRRFGNWGMRLLEAPGADDLVQQLVFGATVADARARRLVELMFEVAVGGRVALPTT